VGAGRADAGAPIAVRDQSKSRIRPAISLSPEKSRSLRDEGVRSAVIGTILTSGTAGSCEDVRARSRVREAAAARGFAPPTARSGNGRGASALENHTSDDALACMDSDA